MATPTGNLFADPRVKPLSVVGQPQSGCYYCFFLTGTTTLANVYSDGLLTTPLSQPAPAAVNPVGFGTVSASDGRFVPIYLNPTVTYRAQLYSAAGLLLEDTDPYTTIIGSLSPAVLGAVLYPQTAAEITAGVTPTNYVYPPGDARRYGVVGDGGTDDTAALQRWASVGGGMYFPSFTAKITAAIALVSNSTISIAAGGVLQTATNDISFLSATSKTNVIVRGGHFKQTSAGGAAYVAGVYLGSCTYSEVRDAEFEGMQWSGVYLDSSSQCKVIGNYIHDSLLSSAGDKNDICVYRNSSFNLVQANRCYGGLQADHGILVQDPGGIGTYLPAYNKVLGNWVADHRSYGIVVYIGGTQQGNNSVIANTVQNITGTGIVGASGTGIYCVGFGLGTMQVHSNIVRNCCISTTSAANGPGGISINATAAGASRVEVCNNTVEEMAQGAGILISTVVGGAVVSGNTVRIPASNNGAGPGGAPLAGEGIRLVASFECAVGANSVLALGTNDAFLSLASGASVDSINVSGNNFRASTGNALRIDRTAAFVHTDCVISGNKLRTDAAANMIDIVGADRLSVTGNTGSSNTAACMNISNVTRARISNNQGNTNGTLGLTTSGTCTGSYYDKTNGINGFLQNSATGLITEQLANAAPSSASYVAAVGDRVEQSVPVVGNPKGWRCTVAGNPGTWISEGNL